MVIVIIVLCVVIRFLLSLILGLMLIVVWC